MTTPQSDTPSSILGPWQALWKTFRLRPGIYIRVILIRIVISALIPQATAWMIRTFFDALTGQAPAGLNLWTVLALLAVIYLSDVPLEIYYWLTRLSASYTLDAVLRANVVERIFDAPGAVPLPEATGVTVNRINEDVENATNLLGMVIPGDRGQRLHDFRPGGHAADECPHHPAGFLTAVCDDYLLPAGH